MPTTSADPIDLDEGLRRFGFDAFRPGQRDAIEALLHQRALLLVAPTGGGKSLTYQLPAAMLPGTALVVSPLVALMADQVASLDALDIPATYLASTLSSDEIRTRMARTAAGEYKLVYVAPERLASGGFRSLLHDVRISLVAVDEAHCISEWGHDFRPEYMMIGDVLRDLDPPRVLACTATATPVVRDEIVGRLGLPADAPQIVRGFARPNLALRVAELRKASERAALVDTMLAEALGRPGDRVGDRVGAVIIYAPTRKSTEHEASRLTQKGWRAGAYHAGMTGKQRDVVQNAFMHDALDVVVATNAFGMGIDRADVRAVIHLAPPGSVEAYYQEVGRAGRDGEPAHGLLMYTPNDVALRRRLLERGNEDGPDPDPSVVEHKWNLFLELIRWAEGGSCRHDAILRYFGDEAETLHGCGRCDVCQSLGGDTQYSADEIATFIRKALSGVARVHGRFGLGLAVKLLRGSKDDRLTRTRLDEVSTYGVLAERSEAWVTKLLRRCVTAGWIDFLGKERPVVYLTEEGQAVMRGQRHARLLLPPDDTGVPARKSSATTREAVLVDLDATGLAVFEALRRYRVSRAKQDGVPPYVVASDRTLRDIALLRPRSTEELSMAHGIGPAKLERYGAEFLDVVANAAV